MTDSEVQKKELIDLAKRFVKGDKDAFSDIYDIYADKLYRFVYFKVKADDIEDIVELCFLKAWDKRKSYNPKKSSLNSWLYTIARNSVIDYYRVAKQVEELNVNIKDEKKVSNPKKTTEDILNANLVRKAIEELPENYKDLVVLRFIDDLSYAELSEALAKTEATIRVMQFRAMKKLKAILKREGIDSNNI